LLYHSIWRLTVIRYIGIIRTRTVTILTQNILIIFILKNPW